MFVNIIVRIGIIIMHATVFRPSKRRSVMRTTSRTATSPTRASPSTPPHKSAGIIFVLRCRAAL